MAEQFKWINWYTEFATKLLPYKDNRKELIRKIQRVFESIGMKMPKLEKDGEPFDIDTFTIFGLFNKGITEANRIAIIRGIGKEFAVEAEVPETFEGIPVLNNLKATFYFFKDDRGEGDIDNLWTVFEAALRLADTDSAENRQALCAAYDRALKQMGIRWNITIGLYWIRPYSFINLDSRNRSYVQKPGKMPAGVVADVAAMQNVPTADKYMQLRDTVQQQNSQS